jgi:hypothetical protein
VNSKRPLWEAENPTLAPGSRIRFSIQYDWHHKSQYYIILISASGSAFELPHLPDSYYY